MGRPVFPYELDDPDFSWLVSTFQETNPRYVCCEHDSLPLVFIKSAGVLESVAHDQEKQIKENHVGPWNKR